MSAGFVTGGELWMVRLRIWARIAWLAARTLRAPRAVAVGLRRLLVVMARHRSLRGAAKYVKAGGRYFWGTYCPGFPSPAFDGFVEGELQRTAGRGPARLQTAILAVTRRCPLACEHCCEWESLNRSEVLSPADLGLVLRRLQDHGAVQVLLSGGEPPSRFDDLVGLLSSARPGTDFWLLTSGVSLTPARAGRLKEAGLTGIFLSLDHWSEEAHDRFRGRAGTRRSVDEAAKAARAAGLAVNVSLVPTRDFVTAENLVRYVEAAQALGAGFIQILEPKAIGHYEGREDVALGPRQRELLEQFAARMNRERGRPGVAYPEAAQRRIGCAGAGDRYLYMDTEGLVHPCPFCRSSAGSAVTDLDGALDALRTRGCPSDSRMPAPRPLLLGGFVG